MTKPAKRRRGESVPDKPKREPMEVEIVFGPLEEDQTASPTTHPTDGNAQKSTRRPQKPIVFRFSDRS